MRDDTLLEPVPAAMAALPTRPTRQTGARWLRQHPDLGLRIGGRCYMWRAARNAIARGVPLSEAEAIGRQVRLAQEKAQAIGRVRVALQKAATRGLAA